MQQPKQADLKTRRERALGRGAELFYDPPVEIVRGEGACLFDRAGRRYTDLYNNVPCVGHGNAIVAEAMGRQQATLNVHSRYLHEGIVAFAERLVGLLHPGIESVVFSCTGTEANEVALRMARAVTGRRGIVCTSAAYHGSSGLVDELTEVGTGRVAGRAVRGFPYPDLYRPLAGAGDAEALAEVCLDAAAEAIRGLEQDGHGFAGLIICPILANEGLQRIPAGFLARLTTLVHEAGGLMISDEVQSGYSRTGAWWGYELEGFLPDIVVMGKPMGNGLPLAATAAGRSRVEAFRAATGYFNTFAATPLQAAVGMAVLDEIERMGLASRAGEIGDWLRDRLVAVSRGHPAIGEVRGRGLFVCMEVVENLESRRPDAEGARRFAGAMKEEGFLLSNAGAFGNVIKIRPPLVFSREDAERTVGAVERCLACLGA
jgi:4-aminobutyrate aminotransferase-like enzyme